MELLRPSTVFGLLVTPFKNAKPKDHQISECTKGFTPQMTSKSYNLEIDLLGL